MLQAHHLSKTYNSKKGISCPAVIDVSLEFGKTGMVFILGKSGSGKSTLLNLLSGLDKPDTGEIIVDGHSLKGFTEKDYVNYRNSYIGFIFQEFNLIESMTVKDNLSIALELQNKKSKAQNVEEVLHAVGLDGLEGRMPDELSGGQKQRVAIARALIKGPHIIFADEPTGNLDSETGKDIIELLKALSREKLIIVVTHDRELAETYGDRIIEIKNGQIASDLDKVGVHSDNNPWKYETTVAKLPNRFAVKLAFTAFSEKKGKLFLTILLSVFSLLIFSLSFLLASFSLEKLVVANMKKTDDSLLFAAKIKGKMDEFRAFDNTKAYYGNETISMMRNSYPEIKYLAGTDSLYLFSIGYSDDYTANQTGILISCRSDLEQMNLSLFPNALEIGDDSMYITDYLYNLISAQKLEKMVDLEYESTDISTFFTKDEFGNNIDLEDLNVNELPGKTIYERSMEFSEDFIEVKKVKIAGIVDTDYEYYQNKADNLTEDEKEVYKLKKGFCYTTLYFNDAFYNKCKENIYNESFYLNYEDMKPVIPFYDISINNANIDALNVSKDIYYTPLFGTGEIDDQSLVLDLGIYNRIFGETKTMYDYFDPETRTVKEVPLHLGEEITIQICDKEGTLLRELKDYKIADITFNGRNTVMVNDETYQNLLPLSKGKKYLMINMPESTTESISLLNDLSSQGFSFFSTYSMELYQFQEKISLFSKIFSAASVGLLIFSILLIMNFITTSVTIRRKEIGILRGLGARTTDVVKIFNVEGLFIATLIASFNIALLIVGIKLIEKVFASVLGAPATYISLTAIHIAVVLAVSFLVVLLSSLIPVKRVGRMRPVDAIRKIS